MIFLAPKPGGKQNIINESMKINSISGKCKATRYNIYSYFKRNNGKVLKFNIDIFFSRNKCFLFLSVPLQYVRHGKVSSFRM